MMCRDSDVILTIYYFVNMERKKRSRHEALEKGIPSLNIELNKDKYKISWFSTSYVSLLLLGE